MRVCCSKQNNSSCLFGCQLDPFKFQLLLKYNHFVTNGIQTVNFNLTCAEPSLALIDATSAPEGSMMHVIRLMLPCLRIVQ